MHAQPISSSRVSTIRWPRASSTNRYSTPRTTPLPGITLWTPTASLWTSLRYRAGAGGTHHPGSEARKKQSKAGQTAFVRKEAQELSTATQEYGVNGFINEIRGHVETWRAIPNPSDWGVTPATQRLLAHWRREEAEWHGIRPFFCQIEAVETAIWLAEVARRERRHDRLRAHLRSANEGSNPELSRIALKMATGAGKTTVMAMLIAWQTVNAVRTPNSNLYSRAFLVVAPGITIKDRLRVLQPNDPDSYFRGRDLIPMDMLPEIAKAKIVITNFHAFKRRETMEISKTGRSLLQGRDAPLDKLENDGQMLHRVADDLLGFKGIVVLNDEAHHCYREKPESDEELGADEREEAKKNSEAARLWIGGLEAVRRKLGITALYDLSATPFFLRGSGHREGTLFPWTVSDFSLMDAIECGIVKLPRIPVSDNLPSADVPIYRNLWDHIGKKMPEAGRGKGGKGNPLALPNELQTALYALCAYPVSTGRATLSCIKGDSPVPSSSKYSARRRRMS
jgi:type III restriction enzyme